MIRMLLLALAMLAPAHATETWPDIDTPLRTGASAPNDAAVVIGNEDYVDIPDVPYAGADADAFYTFLVYTRGVPADRVQLLDNASPKQMERAVEQAASEVGAGGVLWVYYAGHGAAHPSTKERMFLGKGATLDPDPVVFEEGSVSLETLKTVATSSQGQVVFVADACYSGAGRDGAALGDGRFAVPPAYTPTATVTEWTATQPDQIASPLDGAGHGAFTYFAVRALRGWADGEVSGSPDGVVNIQEAQAYVTRELRAAGLRNQRPAVVGEDAVVLIDSPSLESAPESPGRLASSRERETLLKGPDSALEMEAITKSDQVVKNDTSIVGKYGYEMVQVPSGRFTMGQGGTSDDAKPAHTVSVSGFWMGTTEVTQGLYQQVMGTNPSYFSRCGASCPVEMVSWVDAVTFANKLSALEGLEACYDIHQVEVTRKMRKAGDDGVRVSWPNERACTGYRLPTEAEWEYAARAGQSTTYSGSNELGEVAWYKDNSGNKTHPVAQKRANSWGLYDMSGNVLEWVWDWYDEGYYQSSSSIDPAGPNTGSRRVLRSSSLANGGSSARIAIRGSNTPFNRNFLLGFRLSRSVQTEVYPLPSIP